MIESKTLPQITDLDREEINAVLARVHYGHLAFCNEGRPYVVPMHIAYGKPGIYFYTTEGLKTDILEKNPIVCLQVQEVRSDVDWDSVIVTGPAEQLTTEHEIDTAMKLIKKHNPHLAPAWSIRWLDDQIRSNIDVVYRISPETITGRRAAIVSASPRP